MLKLRNKKSKGIEENLIKAEKKKQELNKIHYLPKFGIGLVLIIAFILTDFIFIRQLVDVYFTQSETQTNAASAVIACLIDVSPSLLAGFLSVKKKEKIHYIGMSITIVLLLACFGFLALLRINSADLIYQTASTQISSLAADTTQSVNTKGQTWMSAIFCILPIFTSVISFMIGIFENSANKETYLDKIAAIRNKNQLIGLEANNLELELELERDLKSINVEERDLELVDIINNQIILKELARMKMAKSVGTPQALTNFMETLDEENDRMEILL